MASTADKFARLAALKPARPVFTHAERAALRPPGEEDSLGQLLGAGVARNHFGEHLAIRNWYSTPEFQEPSCAALEFLSRVGHESVPRNTRAALENPSKWLFLDTETTGLAGGTGTYAFLVGLAWWDAGGLQVEQFFMRDFTEEYSILFELSARVAERPVLVTFNGKSFDWPLLENRFAMTRTITVPSLAAHLDMLHPARALWKLRLGSVRLVQLERGVLDLRQLGWHRDVDVASALIPQFYFDYLRGGPREPLAAVVKHNQLDLRGLAALFGKINAMLSEPHGILHECESLDLFGLSRFLQRRGEPARAQAACAQALAIGLPPEVHPKALRELALLAKRHGDHDRAAKIWEEMIVSSNDEVQACEQLAIHYERRAKNISRAIELTKLGLARLTRGRKTLRNSSDPCFAARCPRQEKNFRKRLARLEGKAPPSSPPRRRDVPEAPERKARTSLW